MARRSPRELGPAIRRGRIQELTTFEITEAQLEQIEQGPPESVYLTFALSLLSSAASFLVTLLTTTVESTRTFTVFVVFTTVGFLAGTVSLVLWRRTRRSVRSITAVIRAQQQFPEGQQEPGGVIPPEVG